ncbi:MAG: hypothetical protein IBJ11_02905 [Phycisphaerales bacterium]|nr:hypothetical protein [Phycisphaerales bacterium]
MHRSIPAHRPFLVGLLSAGLALTPAVAPMVSAQPAPAAKPDAVYVYSAGLDGLLIDRKDAGLLRALKMLEPRLSELPRELDQPQIPAPLIKMVWDILIHPMTIQAGPIEGAKDKGAFPGYIQLTSTQTSSDDAVRIAQTLGGLLETGLGEMQEVAGRDGMKSADTPAGKAFVGTAKSPAGGSFIIGLNRAEPPAAPLSFGLPEGVKPVLSARFDFRALTPMFDTAFAQAGPGERAEADQFKALLTDSGLYGPDAMIISGGLGLAADRGIGVIKAEGAAKSSKRIGMKPENPIGPAVLKMVPADATHVTATHVDLAVLPKMLRDIAARAGENVDPIDEVRKETGYDVEKDFIAHLGNTAVIYRSDSTGGGGPASLVGILALTNPAGIKATLDRVRGDINRVGARQARGYVRVKQWKAEDVEMQTLTFPGFPAPLEVSWTIEGSNLVVGFTPRTLISAVGQIRSGKSSILDNRQLAEMAGGKLEGLASLSFNNTPRSAAGGYGLLSVGVGALANAVRSPIDQERDPGLIMPSFADLTKDTRPTVLTMRWQGDDLVITLQGDRSMLVNAAGAVGSFSGVLPVAAPAIALSTLLPALGRAREQARHVRSASQVRQVAMAITMYANDHKDAPPKSAKMLIDDGLITEDILRSPVGPANDGGDDFTFRSDKKLSQVERPSDAILAIDRAALVNGQRQIAVGFYDGHVEMLTVDELQSRLKNAANKGAAEALNLPDWMKH